MDQTKANFYGNQILEAIETVATSVTSKLNFDKTILCTITNDKNKKNGEYEVSDGSSTFKVYSEDDSYTKDMAVYVLIPQGNYDNQKTIVGKYVDDVGSSIKYIPASESIIEIVRFDKTEAPVSNKIQDKEWSLLANGSKTDVDVYHATWTNNTNIYTCASLKANFRTNLSQYNMVSGDYGLLLILDGYKSQDDGTLKKIDKAITYKFSSAEMYGNPYNYNIYFNHDIVFDLTEHLKDVKITDVKIKYYQDGSFTDLTQGKINSSVTEGITTIFLEDNLFVKDIELAFGYTTEDITSEGIRIYTTSNSKFAKRDDTKKILLKWFTKNSIGSKAAYGIIDEMNEAKDSGRDFSVYWYRYKIGNQGPDPILGKDGFWEIIPGGIYNDKKYVHQQQQKMAMNYETQTNEGVYETGSDGKPVAVMEDTERLEYTLIQDNNGKYTKDGEDKLILALPTTAAADRYKIEIKTELVYDASLAKPELNNPFIYNFGPNELLDYEKIKVVLQQHQYEEVQTPDEDNPDIVYIHFIDAYDRYISNELVFENENPADKNLAGVDFIRNLRLECGDLSDGVYMIYNETTGAISDTSKRDNVLYAKFDNYTTKDIPKADEKCKITWKIPANSMIEPVNFKMPYEEETIDGETYYQINTTVADTESRAPIEWVLNGGYYELSYYWTVKGEKTTDAEGNEIYETTDAVEESSLLMHYALKSNYIRHTNDVVICEIEKYGKKYTEEIKMSFGSAGVSGTKYSLVVSLGKKYGDGADPSSLPSSLFNVDYLNASEPNTWIKVTAKLYNEKFKDITDGRDFDWELYNDNGSLEIKDGDKNNECYIRLGRNAKSSPALGVNDIFQLSEYYGILQVSVQAEWASLENEVTLTTYLPIGVKKDDSIKQYTGAEKLIYNTQGNAPENDGFQSSHTLSPKNADYWKLKLIGYNDENHGIYHYAPTFKKNVTKEEEIEIEEGKKEIVYKNELVDSSTLTPTNLYYNEMKNEKMTIFAFDSSNNILFAQPLYYGQDVYNVSLLNNWGGNQIIDPDGNKILTALVGAGIKESDNTFSGVFMGTICDVGSTDNGKKTGLLGFQSGQHTFGFHTDGTAFIGPPGQGRIEFDGTQGIISSQDKNTEFNLKEGSIYLSNSNNDAAAAQILIDSTGTEAYFQIKAKSIDPTDDTKVGTTIDKELIKIAASEYYLQSRQYTDGEVTYTEEETLEGGKTQTITTKKDGAGVKFDLQNGSLHGYDFELIAGGNVTTQIAGETTSSTVNKQIRISSKDADIPFSIGGDQFTIKWDGTMEAKNGYFTGEITANTGTIGNWTIVKNALFKNDNTGGVGYLTGSNNDTLSSFTASSGTALIAPDAGITVSGLATFIKNSFVASDTSGYENGSSKYFNLPVVDPNSGKLTSATSQNSTEKFWQDTPQTIANDEIVFAIGENFVVTKNGTLYANGAVLNGYTDENVLPNLSAELINIATGKVGKEAVDRAVNDAAEAATREAADNAEQAAREAADAAEESARKDADAAEKTERTEADAKEEASRIANDNGLRGYIGGINFNLDGALSQVGYYGDQSVFIDSTLGIADSKYKLVGGYADVTYDKDSTTLKYVQKVKTFYDITYEYKDKETAVENVIYQDIDYPNVFCKIQSTLTDADGDGTPETKVSQLQSYTPTPEEKNYAAKVYITQTADVPPKITLYKSKIPKQGSTKITGENGTFYVDLNTGKCYKYDSGYYDLISPDDKVVMFMVKTNGLFQTTNAVIHGTIYAHSGYIGGWTIQHGGLTYGNIDKTNNGSNSTEPWAFWSTDVNLTPKGLYIKNGKLFDYDKSEKSPIKPLKTAFDRLPKVDGTTEVDMAKVLEDAKRSSGDSDKEGYYADWIAASNAKNCILNIGLNFAVDDEGVLYANGARLNGYAKSVDLSNMKNDLTTYINGQVGGINDEIAKLNSKYGSIIKVDTGEDGTGTATFMTKGDGIEGGDAGYYNTTNGKFYSDASYTKEIIPKENWVYLDKSKGNLYKYNGSSYVLDNTIKFFSVSTEGLLTANNMVVSGTVYATNGWFSGGITAAEGQIGGWTISSNSLSLGKTEESTNYTITLGSNTALTDASYIQEDLSNYSINEYTFSINLNEQYYDRGFYYYYLFTSIRDESKNTEGYVFKNNRAKKTYNATLNNSNEEITSKELIIGSTVIEDEDISRILNLEINQTSTQLQVSLIGTDQMTSNTTLSDRKTPNPATITLKIYTMTPRTTYYYYLNNNKNIFYNTDKASLLAGTGSESTPANFVDNVLKYSGPNAVIKKTALLMMKMIKIGSSPIFRAGTSGLSFNIGLNGSLIWMLADEDSKNHVWRLGASTNESTSQYGLYYNDLSIVQSTLNGLILLHDAQDGVPGGFKITGNDSPSTKFWRNAIYTNNTIPKTTKKYLHYTGFLRAVGFDSQKFSNVFLGAKAKTTTSNQLPNNNEWADNNLYTFYIRFDGKSKFNDITLNSGKVYQGSNALINGTETEDSSAATSINNLGREYAAIKLTKGGFGYYCITSIPCGAFGSSSTSTMYWDVGIDGATGTNEKDRTFTYTINLSSDSSTKKSAPPRKSFQFMVKRPADGTTSSLKDRVYFLVKSRAENDSIGEAQYSYLGSTSYPWSTIYLGHAKNNPHRGRIECIQMRGYAPPDKNTVDSKYYTKGTIGLDTTESTRTLYNRMYFKIENYEFKWSNDAKTSYYENHKPVNAEIFFEADYFVDSTSQTDTVIARFAPWKNDGVKLGAASLRWANIYASDSNILNAESISAISETYSNVSDMRLKTINENIDINQILLIYNNLKPVAYKYKNLQVEETHKRTHIGFLAQEVEQSIFKAGLTNEDFAIVQIATVDNNTPGCEDGKKYYLNYNELHGLHVLKNQEQDKRILELERKVQQLEQEILNLRGKGV